MKTFKAVQLEQLKRIQSSQLGTGSRGDVLEHQNPLKPLKKWIILIALQFCYTFCLPENQETEGSQDQLTGEQQSLSGSDKERRNRLQ